MSLDVNLSEPDEFNCVELHSCINNIARMKNIDDFAYHVEFASGKGENFIANVFRVTITDVNDSERQESVIVKTLVNTVRQELFRELHKREVKAYADVIPKFQSIQMKISADDRMSLPVCILYDTKIGNELLILEDLLQRGYEYDSKIRKLQNMDRTQVGLVLSELAKFHALSIVLERDDEYFSDLKREFADIVFDESFLDKSKLKDYYTDSYEASVNLVVDEEIKHRLLRIKTKLLDLLRDFTRPRKFNVICHGDCWVNNFMFKQNKNDHLDTRICFLDYQAMRYSNPATDIIYFLYLCTDSAFRSKYMQEILLVYYNSFESFLKLFDIDSNIIYPRESFMEDIKEIMPFGLLIALVELRIVISTNEDEKFDEASLESESTSSSGYDNKVSLGVKVNDVVKESIDNGVLNSVLDLIGS